MVVLFLEGQVSKASYNAIFCDNLLLLFFWHNIPLYGWFVVVLVTIKFILSFHCLLRIDTVALWDHCRPYYTIQVPLFTIFCSHALHLHSFKTLCNFYIQPIYFKEFKMRRMVMDTCLEIVLCEFLIFQDFFHYNSYLKSFLKQIF